MLDGPVGTLNIGRCFPREATAGPDPEGITGGSGQPAGKPREAGKPAGFGSWLNITMSTQRRVAMKLREQYYTRGRSARRCSRAPRPHVYFICSPWGRGGVESLCCLGKVNRDRPGATAILSSLSSLGRCMDRQQACFSAS